ncbi:MGMT family protein [Ktedonospora formicarum]|uniref:Methylated-DNA-[protein]-cysteine S-methyltransferase DNA binding domain-containing protein n=1 Tax=Ktedonospora formicarum TaxID=2778364 RepID=A0A8J3MYX1_9CHLR|nr:MGMT family protein [Ktedonospora formicarum]GHO51253.1 hypothetical protein KSX_94160 [Ktedonospora formicarum]
MFNEGLPTYNQVAKLMAHVFSLVQACPAGRVTTYSWVGKALGYSRGARMIGWVMKEVPRGIPAHRVVNSKGELTGSWAFGPKGEMRQCLEAEGVVFSLDGRVDLKRYGWDPSQELDATDLQHILASTSPSVKVSERLLYLLRNDPASPLKE